MPTTEIRINQTNISLVQGDITAQSTDAIVNAANPGLMGGGGVDGAIHRAGGPAILQECRQIIASRGPLPTGQAVITTGGRLKARYVIHTVGPVWHGGNAHEAGLLASAYRESLKLAAERQLTSIAFPSISTGAYGYPVEQASRVALNAVADFLKADTNSIREVVFVLHSKDDYDTYASALENMAVT
jgi:O-acetyl-ADP-ribose deacetylase (regulator of RNase III)